MAANLYIQTKTTSDDSRAVRLRARLNLYDELGKIGFLFTIYYFYLYLKYSFLNNTNGTIVLFTEINRNSNLLVRILSANASSPPIIIYVGEILVG